MKSLGLVTQVSVRDITGQVRSHANNPNRFKLLLIVRQVLRVPIYQNIRQLIISPCGEYLAIATSHTVIIAILPDPSHLSSEDASPLRLKTYQIGPTTHVLEHSPIASLLWHPLGHEGACLLTVTDDAVVRLWELDRDNRWSFDRPASATDLKRLANGSSSSQDFSPSKYRESNGFSPDKFEMEVAAACFGGKASETENGWASMTLWIAMKNGDIYALCPILPSKFRMRQTLLAALAQSISLGCVASKELDADGQTRNRQLQQSTWIGEIINQASSMDSRPSVDGVFTRPLKPSAVPRLQGPFRFEPDREVIFDVTDIYVIPAMMNDDTPVESHEPDLSEEEHSRDFSPTMVCIASSEGDVHVLVPSEEHGGSWLPYNRVS